MRYIFIDESGDLGKQGSKYFIIAAIATNDPRRLRRIIKRFRQRKLKKELGEASEIKANKSTPEIRKYILSELKKCECQIFLLIIDKGKILSKFDEAQDKLYHYLCKILLYKVSINDGKTIIIIDQKDTNKLIKKNFRNYIEMAFKKKGCKIEFHQEHSFNDNGLQVADFVAWSVNRKLNFNEGLYYEIITDKIANKDSMALWEDKDKRMDPSPQSNS